MATWPSPPPCRWPRTLKKNPRELAQALVERCSAQPAVQRWVQALEIAGPGFINLRLNARRQAGGGGRGAARGDAFGRQAASGRARAGRVRLRQPHRPAARGPRPPGGAGRLRSATCSRPRAGRCTREFYYNDAGVQIATLAASTQARLQGPEARRRRLARGGLQRRLHRRHRRRLPRAQKTVQADDREFTASRRLGRPGRHPPVRGGLPAPRAGPGPAGLRRALRPLLPRIQPVHQRPGRRRPCSAWSPPARPTRRTARCGCAAPTTATTRTA